LGIRPDIINLHALIKELKRVRARNIIVHTGQHYSFYFDKVFLDELKYPKPNYHLKIGSGTQAQQTARLFERFDKVLEKEKPDIVFSFSDANPALSGIVASKKDIKVAHLEAGMRSYDWRMPEEKNRRLLDSISDYLFTPTKETRQHLLDEGILPHKIFVVGKLIVDVLHDNMEKIKKNNILEILKLEKDDYFLATVHRVENVSVKQPLQNIFNAFDKLYKIYGKKIIIPIHPRTLKNIKKFGLQIPKGVIIIDPLGFFEFVQLEKNTFCNITDSGTVQEESCIFKVPCVTTRVSSERSETQEIGSNIIAGLNTSHIVKAVQKMVNRRRNWKNPYGGPGCAQKIVKTLQKHEKEILTPKVWWNHPKITKSYSISAYLHKWKNPYLPDGAFDK